MGVDTTNQILAFHLYTVILTLESDISEVCERDGTILLCLLADDTLEIAVEVEVQISDMTTQGN